MPLDVLMARREGITLCLEPQHQLVNRSNRHWVFHDCPNDVGNKAQGPVYNVAMNSSGGTPSRQAWISTAPSSAPDHVEPSSGPVPPALLPQPSGPVSAKLANAASKILPLGSDLVSQEEYPDINAAQVVFALPDGGSLLLAGQQLTKPITLSTITMGSTVDSLETWATGSTAVIVRHLTNGQAQVVMARPHGFLLTVTETRPSALATEPCLASTSDALASLIQAKLDDESLDR